MSNVTIKPPPLPEAPGGVRFNSTEPFGVMVIICNEDPPFFTNRLDTLVERPACLMYAPIASKDVREGVITSEFSDSDGLVEAVTGLLEMPYICQNPSMPIYTIHRNSLLHRAVRLLEMRKHITSHRMFNIMQRTVDLVEYFHTPEILTYSDRKSFSLERVAVWIPEAGTPESQTAVATIPVLSYLAQLHQNGYG